MMAADLSDASRRVLTIILENGLIRGFDLQHRAELETPQLLVAGWC